MSFSSDVKEELSRQSLPGRHCQIAELAAMISFGSEFVFPDHGAPYLSFLPQSTAVNARLDFLLFKVAGLKAERTEGSDKAALHLTEPVLDLLVTLKMTEKDGSIREELMPLRRLLLQKECCRRSFARGAFLAAGSLSDPRSSYHLEILSEKQELAEMVCSCLQALGIPAKTTLRGRVYVTYVKESEGIVRFLGLTGAPVALMEVENVRILKDMRNSVNRKVNCETANLNKTVAAFLRLKEDILFLKEQDEYAHLPESLKEIADLRLAYPDDTLKELGERMEPPVGKSGVNHRLRKLSELAEEIRESVKLTQD